MMITINNPARFVVINVVVFTLIGLFFWFVFSLRSPRAFPIQTVKVVGQYQHIEHAKIKQLVQPLTDKSFFNVDIKTIRDELLQLSWLESANVMRVWPNRLVITLNERTPIAIWNGQHLMTKDAVLFGSQPEEFVTKLPELIGPVGQENEMLKKYRVFSRILSPLDLHIKQLRLTSSGVLSLRLANGIVIMLGDHDAQVRLGRFVSAYPALKMSRHDRAKRVDLRYGDGIAVRWR